jgi:hypothetical protein
VRRSCSSRGRGFTKRYDPGSSVHRRRYHLDDSGNKPAALQAAPREAEDPKQLAPPPTRQSSGPNSVDNQPNDHAPGRPTPTPALTPAHQPTDGITADNP